MRQTRIFPRPAALLALSALALATTACTVQVVMPEVPTTHPVHPQAASAPLPAPSPLLDSYRPIDTPPQLEPMDHEAMGHGPAPAPEEEVAPEEDPHAEHRMEPEPSPEPDPHAGHSMEPEPEPDPHAGHSMEPEPEPDPHAEHRAEPPPPEPFPEVGGTGTSHGAP